MNETTSALFRLEQHGNRWHVIDAEDDTVLATCDSRAMADQVLHRWLERVQHAQSR